MKNTYLITGGSGFLGINLVRYLLSLEQQVVVLDLTPFDYPERDRIQYIQGDIRDKSIVAFACKNIDCVIHAAAALPLYSEKDIYSIDIDGTENILKAAAEAGINRVVHISSTAVYGIPDHHPLTEEDELSGVGPYGKAKIMAENICLDYRKQGLTVPILRPKTFIGPERLGIFALLYNWAADGKNFPLPGKGNNRYQLLDVQDLCEVIYTVSQVAHNRANQTYNIGASVFKTIREDFQAVLDYAGFGKRIISLPALPAVFILRILDNMKMAPVYQWVYETVFKDSFVSIDKARNTLGFNPTYSNTEALIRNYEWYMNNRSAFENNSGLTHREAWDQGVLKLLKIFF